MRQRVAANLRAWVTDRSEFVLLRLEEVGVDRTRLHAELALQPLDLGNVALAVRQVPKHVQCHGRTRAGQLVDLRRVRELFLHCRRCASLREFAESRARIGEAPRGNLNSEPILRRRNPLRRSSSGPCSIRTHGKSPQTHQLRKYTLY